MLSLKKICPRCIQHIRNLSHQIQSPSVAIVGSGPAGFYTAQQLLKGNPSITVDVYDKLPVPFGLVRFGVAPDHPEVKNVINTFTQTAEDPRCSFLGNVEVGKDIKLKQLRDSYTAVVLAYGASEDKSFGIPGEDINGVLSARKFVGWYNGLPDDADFNPDLSSTDTAVILGQGNVALDVARMLLTPVDILKETDITEHALETLQKSTIRRVHIVGRRGPLQVAFTIKELREMTKLPGVQARLDSSDFRGIEHYVNTIARPRKRLTELMIKTAMIPQRSKEPSKEWSLIFKRTPLKFFKNAQKTRIGGVKLGVNKLKGEPGEKQVPVLTGETEDLSCGIVFRSIGYKSVPICKDIPFNVKRGTVESEGISRVKSEKGLYSSGWVKTGPVGVILTTMTDGFETGKEIISDLESNKLVVEEHHSNAKQNVLKILNQKNIKVVSFSDWEKIDTHETVKGEKVGKPREKIVDLQEMLKVVS